MKFQVAGHGTIIVLPGTWTERCTQVATACFLDFCQTMTPVSPVLFSLSRHRILETELQGKAEEATEGLKIVKEPVKT